MSKALTLNELLTIDKTGMPAAPNIAQLLDADVRLLYMRDKSRDKSQYIKEVGVIYYLGDPKGPCLSEGLNRNESIKRAIDNFDLPANYVPDLLVEKLIKKYHDQKSGVASQAVESLQKAIHNITIAANIINELLGEKLSSGLSAEDASFVIDIMDKVNKRIIDLPNMITALNKAKEEMSYEEELKVARGGNKVLSSYIEED